MSNTPRTDAEWTDDYYCSGYVPEEFARQLERELAEAVAKERERCAKIVEQYTGAWDDEGFALAAKIRKGE
jgi:hypothetical protein